MARSRRSGFTLVELLVVVAVVGLLLALLVTAGFAVIGTSREAATKANLRIIDSIIAARGSAMEIANARSTQLYEMETLLTAIQSQADGAPSPSSKTRLLAVKAAIKARIEGIAAGNRQVMRILTKKEYYRLHFPQTWEEAEYQLALQDLPAITSDPQSETESAEVLCFIMTSGKVVGSTQVDSESIPASIMRDTDGNGRREIVDAWNRPVRFYRWPTRLLKSDGTNITTDDKKNAGVHFYTPAGQETQDSLDPIGISAVGASGYEAEYHLPATYHLMIVVSAGPDGEFGLEKPTNSATFGKWAKPSKVADLYDNISSRAL